MNPVLEKAAAHFSDIGDKDLHEIQVVEWETSVFFKSSSSMNGLAFNKYLEYLQAGTFESIVDQLILRARKQDGTKMFSTGDKKDMMNLISPKVIGRIVNEMARIDNEQEETAKKG